MTLPGTRLARTLLAMVIAVALSALSAAGAGAATLKPGQLLVTENDDGLVLIDPTTGKMSVLSSNSQPINAASQFFGSPSDVALTSSGRILVSNYTGRNVISVDPATGKQTLISSNTQPVNAGDPLFSQPSGIVVQPSGRILVLDRTAFGNSGGVIAVDPATGKQTKLSANDQPVNSSSQFFADPRGGIELSRTGEILVVDANAFGGGGVISVDPATGKQAKLSANDQPVNSSSQFFALAHGLSLRATGELLVSDQSAFPGPDQGGVIAVNPLTGKQRKVSGNDQPINAASAHMRSPNDVITALDGRLIVVDADSFGMTGCADSDGCGGLIAVDPLTGRQRLLSSNTQPVNSGSQFHSSPSGIAVVPPRCQGKPATIVGTPAGETIPGTAGADVIAARGGADKISGKGGKDLVCAGGGNDTVRGGPGKDRLRGNAGRDRLIGGRGRDRLLGGGGRDLLRGGPGKDLQKQ